MIYMHDKYQGFAQLLVDMQATNTLYTTCARTCVCSQKACIMHDSAKIAAHHPPTHFGFIAKAAGPMPYAAPLTALPLLPAAATTRPPAAASAHPAHHTSVSGLCMQ